MNKKILTLALAGLFPLALSHNVSAETTFSGLIEVEASFSDEEDDTATTVELGVDHKHNEKVDGHILFLYEDDDLTVDEAIINLHPTDSIDIAVGRLYVPFGRFDTHFITDPVTLDIGESQEDALLVSKKLGSLGASAYLFKDKADAANDDIDNYGLDLSYENDTFSVGLGYLSDVVDNATAGYNIHAKANFGDATLIAEHIKLDDIGDLNPDASHIELAYNFGGDKVIAATYQETSEAAGLDLPKERVGLAYSMPIYNKVNVTAEYLNTTAYDDSDDDAITLRLSYEF